MNSPATIDGFRLSASPRLSLQRVGEAREPVLVIDGLMREPQALVDFAAEQAEFRPVWSSEGGYPGVRAAAPAAYVARVVKSLAPIVAKAFGLPAVRPRQASCMLSMVTLPPERLAPFQRIPHVDTDDPLQLAWLHFLCDERFGGTAFYRHRATGIEALTPENRSAFEAARDRELAQNPPPPTYPVGDTEHFIRTGAVTARFDRLIVYPSRLLHSGQISAPERLSADPRRGRLTANFFVIH